MAPATALFRLLPGVVIGALILEHRRRHIVAVQRVFRAQAPPTRIAGRLVEELHHHLLMVAAQENGVGQASRCSVRRRSMTPKESGPRST